jgi:hypothetical protein
VPPARVPPNASAIGATVLACSGTAAPSGEESVPPVIPGRPLYALTLEIHAAGPTAAGLASYARPGLRIDAFSQEAVTPALVGKRIRATLTLTGDTRGRRWWVSDVHELPREGAAHRQSRPSMA